MPIPLKPAGPNDERGYLIGIGGGFDAQANLSLAYQVISAASVVDDWRQEVFIDLLGGKSSVGAAAYLAIVTRAPKIAAITAASKSVLPNHAFQRLQKIIKAGGILDTYRDKLAHWTQIMVPREKELCLRDPSAPRERHKAPAMGIYIFPRTEMQQYVNYAGELASAQFTFRRIFAEGSPWPEAKFVELDQMLEALAKERQRL